MADVEADNVSSTSPPMPRKEKIRKLEGSHPENYNPRILNISRELNPSTNRSIAGLLLGPLSLTAGTLAGTVCLKEARRQTNRSSCRKKKTRQRRSIPQLQLEIGIALTSGFSNHRGDTAPQWMLQFGMRAIMSHPCLNGSYLGSNHWNVTDLHH
jgi:hypothetical protein